MEGRKTPMISVIMGVLYRRSDLSLLARAVSSILGQSLGDFELLICDDGSTAEAQRYLEKQARNDGRIRLLRGCARTELAAKLNFCLGAAKGGFIARMDDDDCSLPERFEKQVLYLNGHTEISFVGSSALLEQDGRTAGRRQFPALPQVSDFMLVQPYIHPTLLFRREALEAVGGYCEAKRCFGCEDYDLLLRLYEAGFTGANLPEALLQYTLPPKGQSTRTMKMRVNEVRTRLVRYKALGLLPGKLLYAVKPVAAGLVPRPALEKMKRKRWERAGY